MLVQTTATLYAYATLQIILALGSFIGTFHRLRINIDKPNYSGPVNSHIDWHLEL